MGIFQILGSLIHILITRRWMHFSLPKLINLNYISRFVLIFKSKCLIISKKHLVSKRKSLIIIKQRNSFTKNNSELFWKGKCSFRKKIFDYSEKTNLVLKRKSLIILKDNLSFKKKNVVSQKMSQVVLKKKTIIFRKKIFDYSD